METKSSLLPHHRSPFNIIAKIQNADQAALVFYRFDPFNSRCYEF
jgi:hypothetical protein